MDTTLETVDFAILGAGMVADYHHQAIAANAKWGARLVAVAHYNPTRFSEISTKFDVPCVTQEKMLADPAKATIEAPEASTAADAGAAGDPKGIAPTGHIAIFRDFIHALREDRAPQVDGVEGRRSLATVLAVYRAAGLL